MSATGLPLRAERTSARSSLSANRSRLTRPVNWSYLARFESRSSARLRSLTSLRVHTTCSTPPPSANSGSASTSNQTLSSRPGVLSPMTTWRTARPSEIARHRELLDRDGRAVLVDDVPVGVEVGLPDKLVLREACQGLGAPVGQHYLPPGVQQQHAHLQVAEEVAETLLALQQAPAALLRGLRRVHEIHDLRNDGRYSHRRSHRGQRGDPEDAPGHPVRRLPEGERRHEVGGAAGDYEDPERHEGPEKRDLAPRLAGQVDQGPGDRHVGQPDQQVRDQVHPDQGRVLAQGVPLRRRPPASRPELPPRAARGP